MMSRPVEVTKVDDVVLVMTIEEAKSLTDHLGHAAFADPSALPLLLDLAQRVLRDVQRAQRIRTMEEGS